MAAIASGQATVSGDCAMVGSDAAARVINVKLKHCENRMICSLLPHAPMPLIDYPPLSLRFKDYAGECRPSKTPAHERP
jgi:hypothetical protein